MLEALFALLATLGGDTPVARPPVHPVACHLEVREGDSHTVVASVSAAVPRSGTFALDLLATGNNVARTRQQGAFTLAAGETALLAVGRFGGDDQKVTGTLSLDWEGGETVCALD